eukprot:TRINITY_DN14679_c0_g1_i1.p1 TRINITY_DN14679_c0_g1~~TRINITY_DN14679_c0_g1_i1.p1  ORF type:complete len:140 (-),score=31.37 TRINITY_DN14679_c0_g1_i1:58-420(-)
MCIRDSFGTPNEEIWPGVRSMPDFAKIEFEQFEMVPLQKLIPNASKPQLDFVSGFLRYSGRKTAAEGLNHEYLAAYKDLPESALAIKSSGVVRKKVNSRAYEMILFGEVESPLRLSLIHI